jgi:hypothetical protein
MRMIYLITIFTAATVVFSQNGIKKRQNNQMNRIGQGVKTGELNKKEAIRSIKGQKKIKKLKKNARKDGVVTKKEKKRIHKAQNNESKKIYKRKHN